MRSWSQGTIPKSKCKVNDKEMSTNVVFSCLLVALDGQERVPCHSCGYPTMTALASYSLAEYKVESDIGEKEDISSSDEDDNEEEYEGVLQHDGKCARIEPADLPSLVPGSMEFHVDEDYYLDDDNECYFQEDNDGNDGEEGNSYPGLTSNDSISSSSNVDLDDIVSGSPRRRRTHIENEQSHQQNLFTLLPQLHSQESNKASIHEDSEHH